MRYDPYQPLIAAARPTASLRMLIAGVILTVLISWALNYLLWSIAFALLPANLGNALAAAVDATQTPGGVILNLFFFALLSAALAITLRILHQRNLMSLMGSFEQTVHQFRRASLALIALFIALTFLPMPANTTPAPHLPLGIWLGFLPLTLLGLLIQTSAEELVFRGYIQSLLAARFPHPLIWIGVPSLLFGLLHHDPDLPALNAAVVVLWATLFGIAAADLTARSGTLGPAIALHMVNNFSAIAVAAPEGAFDGLALYTFPFSLSSTDALIVWAPVDLMVLFCSWLAVRLALRR